MKQQKVGNDNLVHWVMGYCQDPNKIWHNLAIEEPTIGELNFNKETLSAQMVCEYLGGVIKAILRKGRVSNMIDDLFPSRQIASRVFIDADLEFTSPVHFGGGGRKPARIWYWLLTSRWSSRHLGNLACRSNSEISQQ